MPVRPPNTGEKAEKHGLERSDPLRRDTLTGEPPQGDYILRPTGFSWSLLRSRGGGSADSISAGEGNKRTAVARLASLAKTDETDGWETAGTGVFWRLVRYRSAKEQ